MTPVVHPGRPLKRELAARPQANRLALDVGVSVRPHHRHPEWAARDHPGHRGAPGRYFGNKAQFWLELQSQYEIALVERDRVAEIAQRVRPA